MKRRDAGSDVVVGVYDARARLSELLEQVEGGRVITVARNGVPVARIVPLTLKSSERRRRDAIEAIRRLADRVQKRASEGGS